MCTSNHFFKSSIPLQSPPPPPFPCSNHLISLQIPSVEILIRLIINPVAFRHLQTPCTASTCLTTPQPPCRLLGRLHPLTSSHEIGVVAKQWAHKQRHSEKYCSRREDCGAELGEEVRDIHHKGQEAGSEGRATLYRLRKIKERSCAHPRARVPILHVADDLTVLLIRPLAFKYLS